MKTGVLAPDCRVDGQLLHQRAFCDEGDLELGKRAGNRYATSRGGVGRYDAVDAGKVRVAITWSPRVDGEHADWSSHDGKMSRQSLPLVVETNIGLSGGQAEQDVEIAGGHGGEGTLEGELQEEVLVARIQCLIGKQERSVPVLGGADGGGIERAV